MKPALLLTTLCSFPFIYALQEDAFARRLLALKRAPGPTSTTTATPTTTTTPQSNSSPSSSPSNSQSSTQLPPLTVTLTVTSTMELESNSPTSSPDSDSDSSASDRPTTTTTQPPVTITPIAGIPPMESITAGDPAPTSVSLTTTYQAGASPPISGAPALPSFALVAADWPALDHTPPTNSSEVQTWLKELDGFDIPDLDPTVDGSCAGDPEAAADAENRGWWTCGGWTRDTDITTCPDKLTWGMSFDDGPSSYSPILLNFLAQNQLKSTFFVVGSRVISYPDVLKEEYMSGHEISVHTWSHSALTKLTNEQIVAEFGWTRKAIQDVLGITPTTMRPPYGDIDDRVRAIALAMGLVPIIWTRDDQGNQFDTNDWKVPGGVVTANESVNAFNAILNDSTTLDTGFIVLEHDLFPQEVDLGVGYFLQSALQFTPKLTMKPIGACQGWPESNMYLETTTNTSFPYPESHAARNASLTTTTAGSHPTNITDINGPSNGASGGSDLVRVESVALAFVLGFVYLVTI